MCGDGWGCVGIGGDGWGWVESVGDEDGYVFPAPGLTLTSVIVIGMCGDWRGWAEDERGMLGG